MVDYEQDEGVQLMLAYQSGDEAAFDQLVERFSGQIYALLTRFLGLRANREDLVQEVFLRVIRSRARYRPTARFSTWLYRITFNISVNERERSEHGTVSLDARLADVSHHDMLDEGMDDPSVRLESDDVVEAVRGAIAGLPDAQRMALILAKYEDMPYVEIAQVLDSSEKAIKSLVHRARENLRATLRPFLQQEFA